MGLYDREYAQTRRPGFAGGAPAGFGMRPGGGMWSANAWIIAICVGVFMIDALVGQRYEINAGRVINTSYSSEMISRAEVRNTPTEPTRGVRFYPMVDEQTGTVVGQERRYVMAPLEAVGHFSSARGFRLLEVWRLVGFQFLHANMSHLFMNMLGLFFFGPIVESRLGRRKYVAFYLICGIAGALMYLILNGLGQINGLTLPGVLINDPYTPLIGASAGVFGVLMASAYLAPNSTVLLFFIIPAPLKAVVYGFVALAAFNLFTGGHNAGGDAAHIGGAIAGAFFVRKPELLREFLDFSGAEASKRRSARQRKRTAASAKRHGGPSDDEVDRILAKVATQGLPSLSEKERKTLQKASAAKRG